MELDFLERFLTVPQIADIVSYVLLTAMFIYQVFVKKFVRRDNIQTLFSVDAKTAKVDELQTALTAERERLQAEWDSREKVLLREIQDERNARREAMEHFAIEKIELLRSIAEMDGELTHIKQAIRIGLMNDPYLVSNGFSKEIAKVLENTKNENEEDIDNG